MSAELAVLRAELTPLDWGVLWDPFHKLYRAVNAWAYAQAPTAEELRDRIRAAMTDAASMEPVPDESPRTRHGDLHRLSPTGRAAAAPGAGGFPRHRSGGRTRRWRRPRRAANPDTFASRATRRSGAA